MHFLAANDFFLKENYIQKEFHQLFLQWCVEVSNDILTVLASFKTTLRYMRSAMRRNYINHLDHNKKTSCRQSSNLKWLWKLYDSHVYQTRKAKEMQCNASRMPQWAHTMLTGQEITKHMVLITFLDCFCTAMNFSRRLENRRRVSISVRSLLQLLIMLCFVCRSY